MTGSPKEALIHFDFAAEQRCFFAIVCGKWSVTTHQAMLGHYKSGPFKSDLHACQKGPP